MLQRPLPLAGDPFLAPYRGKIERRLLTRLATARKLSGDAPSLAAAMTWHDELGLHREASGWVFREWAPHAEQVILVGDFSNWEEREPFFLTRRDGSSGIWEQHFPAGTFRHGMHYRLHVRWPGGEGERLPSAARYVVQDPVTGIFTAQVYAPDAPYEFRHAIPPRPGAALIYEAHPGMAQEEEKIGSFREFADRILPRIRRANYNTVQLMAVMSHPYYGSFGYHVANFFSVSSRFGTPDDFKYLVDTAHGLGLRIIMDLVHSHAVRNEVEGLGRFDGTREQFFHPGARGEHAAWDSLCFNYEKPEVLKFLLSNCRFYLEEYHVDGFRFDGVTSMLYRHHGLNHAFTSYGDYFSDAVDEAACTYLGLANQVIHEVRPDAVTVAEDVSGMPGLAAPLAEGGAGFDYRLAMGVTDCWFKLFDRKDEDWSMPQLFYELVNRRRDEHTLSYVECHDQALVGGQTAIFRLAGRDIYDKMRHCDTSDAVRRATALHKMARLITAATSEGGYLNFMGNEFGHPEWIDFPREGNGWSMKYARRQWHLADDPELFYHDLGEFDRAMLAVLKRAAAWDFALHKLKVDDRDKVIAFERGNLWCVFNFHPTASYTDYGLGVMPGKYRLILDSDRAEYGGFGRVAPEQEYFTHPVVENHEELHRIQLYLPSRTALVLQKAD